MIVPLDFTRVVVDVAYMDFSAWHDQQLLGISPQVLCPPLDIAIERLALLDAGRVGEHDIGGGGAQFSALLGIACLEYDGLPLRGALDVQRADHGKMFTRMVERMQFACVEKLPSLPIPYEGIFLVGIPQSLDDLHMFCSPAVSGVVVKM